MVLPLPQSHEQTLADLSVFPLCYWEVLGKEAVKYGPLCWSTAEQDHIHDEGHC